MKNKTKTRLMIGGTVFLFLTAILAMVLIGSTIDVDRCLFSIGFGQAVAC